MYLRANPFSTQHSSMPSSPLPPQNGGYRLHGPPHTATLPDLEPSSSRQHAASGRAFVSAEPFDGDMSSENARCHPAPLTFPTP